MTQVLLARTTRLNEGIVSLFRSLVSCMSLFIYALRHHALSVAVSMVAHDGCKVQHVSFHYQHSKLSISINQ